MENLLAEFGAGPANVTKGKTPDIPTNDDNIEAKPS